MGIPDDGDESVIFRRDLLRGVGAAAFSMGTAACGSDPEITSEPGDGLPRYEYGGVLGPEDLFQHGVASGDPLADAVILWTRVSSGASDPVDVWWEVATEPTFAARVQVGTFSTNPDRDFTVKLDVVGLEPGTTYFYRFFALGRQSAIGRTRTAPGAAVGRLRFAMASCASLASGYFHAYRAIAERADLDAVIHLGDYIYEYGGSELGGTRPYEPPYEIASLPDYRLRHAQYKRDPDLQEAHRQHAFICVWDDHETANNSWQDGAENHDPATEGSWAERKAAGIQAYLEWMPIREQEERSRIFRRLSYGSLVDLILLDTRLWGRNRQNSATFGPPPAPDPERTLLGDDQAGWLEQALSESTATWKLIGQQVMVGQIILSPDQTLANLDQWQGYPESRERLLSFIGGLENVVILTGDIHSSWANEIVTDPNDPATYDPVTGEGSVAVEFVTPGITSPGLEGMMELIDALRPVNQHVRFVDPGRRGYAVLDVDETRVQAAFYLYDDITLPEPQTGAFAAAWSVQSGSTRLNDDGEAAPPPEMFAMLAP